MKNLDLIIKVSNEIYTSEYFHMFASVEAALQDYQETSEEERNAYSYIIVLNKTLFYTLLNLSKDMTKAISDLVNKFANDKNYIVMNLES